MAELSEEVFPFAKKASLVVFVGGLLATYSHFAGYTFLKGFIEGLGLGSIEFSLTPLESVYQTSQFLKHLTNDFTIDVRAYFAMGWKPFVVLCIVGGFYVWLLSLSFSKKAKTKSNSNKSDKHANTWHYKILKFFAFPVGFGLGMTAIIIFILMLLGISSQIFLLAFDSGKDRAINRLSNKVCVSLSDFKKRRSKDNLKGRRAGCTVIQDKAGNKLTGLVLFQSTEMKIFMTNSITVLFNKDHDVLACAPIVNIDVDDKIDTDLTERTTCNNIAYPKSIDGS